MAVTWLLVVLAVDVSHLFVDLSQLDFVLLQFVVADNFIDFDSPVAVHEHMIVSVGDCLSVADKLLVLRLRFVAKGLY